MAHNRKEDGYYNDGYAVDEEENDEDSEGRVPVGPAPRQYLPRIITGAEIKGGLTKEGGAPPNESTENLPTTPEEENGDGRDTWDNPLEFLLSCISMSVGLGNVWRFPGVAAANGGGAFLIPYLCVLLLIGRPLYYLELCLGQFSRFGQVKIWNMAPFFKGVGYGSVLGTFCLVSYYVPLMALTVRFFISSFAKTLPWAECDQEKHPHISCNGTEGSYAFFYYRYTVFEQLENVNDGLGALNWQLCLCLIFSWVVIFLSLMKGVKSSGKVAYFTAIFPYVVLFILLIRGVTLKGAWKGIRVFLEPQWKEIAKPKVWYAAVEQCFFSLGIGFGPVIMFSSYNPFRQNVYKDALIVSALDTCTSLLAGITIFSVIGSIMEKNGFSFEDIQGLVSGPDLAFVLYPQAIASFGWAPQLFAVLFFLMFFTLGLGTASSLTGGVITMICDQFPTWKRWAVTLGVSVALCLVGLMYVTEGGMFMLDLIDHFGSGFVIYIMVIIECAGISYVYGLNNFCHDIEFMVGRRVGIYWKACWGFIMPVGLLGMLLYYLISEGEFKSRGVAYPAIATIAGWLLTAFAVGLIPVWATHAIVTRKGDSFKEKVQLSFKPTYRWGPQQPKLRQEWQDFRFEKDVGKSGKRFFIF